MGGDKGIVATDDELILLGQRSNKREDEDEAEELLHKKGVLHKEDTGAPE